MRQWFTPAEIVAAGSSDLPVSRDGLTRLAVAAGWRLDPMKGRQVAGPGRSSWEYNIRVLPASAQARLALMHAVIPPSSGPDRDAELWARYEALPEHQKRECQTRLDAIRTVDGYLRAGCTETGAVGRTAAEHRVSPATIWNWRRMVAGRSKSDWLAALAPAYKATAAFSEIHPRAWEILTSDWLRDERPTFSSCYRRMRTAASKNGWLPIPSERSLRRRLEAEVPRGVRVLAREGRDKAKTLFPAQRRVRTHFHAMQAVNMDGHRLDVFVRLADGTVARVHLLALQDLYSGKIVAWRLSETENKETVRLVIGDMVERFGIPDRILLDNGRAFASKWISGGTPNRYRFKLRAEEPQGLLTTLGVEIVWAQPYSGQSKPIERAFRDLADNIAKHPFCAGAYTGNRPDAKPENYGSSAVPLEAFRGHVAEQIAEHNSRPGRRAAAAQGRSFDETFADSIAQAGTIVRTPTEAQRHLWLLAAEKVSAQRGSGEIHFYGNRYWSPAMNAHAGEKVTVRFDPDRLQDPLLVYTSDDRLICRAECIADVGFDNADAARATARDRNAFLKAQREQLRLTAKLSADELARLYAADAPAPSPEPVRTKVTRLAVRGGAAPATAWDADADASFSRALRMFGDDADIIPFTPKRPEDG